MNYKMIARFFSQVTALEAILMVPSLLLALFDRTYGVLGAFALCIALELISSFVLKRVSANARPGFFAREGMVCVGLVWIIISLFGALPFFLTKYIPNYVDAFFEIVSGFTTTGASILRDVEALPRALLLWRSFSHWVGGMGVLVLMMALLRRKDSGGFTLHLLRAESPGPEVAKLLPHMRDSSTVLYGMYIVLTLLNIFFLLIGGMPLFDTLCTAFGTAGTGGFGVRNDSLASYSPYLINVTTVFMLLFGVNFNMYFFLILRRFRSVAKDAELRLYAGIVAVSIILVTLSIRGGYSSLRHAVRDAAFQVATIITTTGYSTTDFDLWSSFPKTILLILMVIGACAGSTGGGMKVSRILILWRSMVRYLNKVIFPQKVEKVRMGGSLVSEAVVAQVHSYLTIYGFILVFSFLAISLDGFSAETNISAVLACFNNIGPGFDAVGPSANYASYSAFSKIVLSIDMLAGRLELLPVVSLILPQTWRR